MGAAKCKATQENFGKKFAIPENSAPLAIGSKAYMGNLGLHHSNLTYISKNSVFL